MDQGKQDGLCQSLEVDGGCGEACLDLPKPLGTRVKTDLADAEMLARMAAALLPDLTPIKDQTTFYRPVNFRAQLHVTDLAAYIDERRAAGLKDFHQLHS